MLPLAAALPLVLVPLTAFVSTLVWMARSSRPAVAVDARHENVSRRGLEGARFVPTGVALARGKELHDKRRDIARRDAERQIERALKSPRS